jgi:hypothetical protein
MLPRAQLTIRLGPRQAAGRCLFFKDQSYLVHSPAFSRPCKCPGNIIVSPPTELQIPGHRELEFQRRPSIPIGDEVTSLKLKLIVSQTS